MANFTALYDACVLYPAPLRDLLVSLAGTGLFRARWSNMIHEEWIENLLENRPDLKRESLERTRTLMDAAVQDCLVTNFEDLIPLLELPDDGDRHVLAAAIRAGADVIVTKNLKDFPNPLVQEKYQIEPQHPDQFVADLLDLSPGLVCATIRDMRARLKRNPRTVEELLGTFEQQGLTETVALLRDYAELL
ncbi:MAG: PIN domain-containing protein [Roseofilum sp. SBFL]|uniref:PIN domain-containing protein n=1 Tax=unclassified Roseofilum TaxID=2620099 RepID=UPI001B0B1160|nr:MULTISPECIES: PIN domain-containing protein [unclassified Roseofilum]MBP0014266.1 PIN domain-containing protein [Roseofilum sp. SID3]MBP0022533.1 PIN domain-containing protein [Roseofilum sp. SID2]MBP0042850.1 PIN domain-containing protein [Roseofilum sp. SBFL]